MVLSEWRLKIDNETAGLSSAQPRGSGQVLDFRLKKQMGIYDLEPRHRHTRESGYPEVFDFPGFRVELAMASLPGMTPKLFNGFRKHHTRRIFTESTEGETSPLAGNGSVRRLA
jgi:hypothetical protein